MRDLTFSLTMKFLFYYPSLTLAEQEIIITSLKTMAIFLKPQNM